MTRPEEKTNQQLSKIVQPAIIDLFEVDLTKIVGQKTIYRFHNSSNYKDTEIIWQGNVYECLPIQAEGFESKGTGTSSRPKLTLSNVTGLITELSESYDDLLGSTVTRRQVMVAYLDAVNFLDGNPNADPTQEMISYFIIERLVSINSLFGIFELSLPSETDGSLIPARIITTDTCQWVYRSSECSYTGKAVADEFDKPTADITKDKCSRCLRGCKLRFGENGILPFGGFPTSARM